jgi:1,4-dihydroxy-2-naphthoate octaprenyltransferase
MTAGTVYALGGSLAPVDFLPGIPIALFVTAILWINEFPDFEADQATGKYNLVVVLGKKQARWGYLALIAGAFGAVVLGVVAGWLPPTALLMLLTVPLAAYAIVMLFRHYRERVLIKANATTIVLHLASGLLLALGLFLT